MNTSLLTACFFYASLYCVDHYVDPYVMHSNVFYYYSQIYPNSMYDVMNANIKSVFLCIQTLHSKEEYSSVGSSFSFKTLQRIK
jgi:hypothetical protein